MKVTYRDDGFGTRGTLGPLIVEVDGETYYTELDQKPLYYKQDVLVFDDLGYPKPGKTIKPYTAHEGDWSESLETGSTPCKTITYDLATTDPVLVAIAKDWIGGRLVPGVIDLKRYR